MAFSPSDIAGLQLWYDGSDPNATGFRPANGTAITTWKNKGGAGATRDAQMIPLPGLFNSYPAYNKNYGANPAVFTLGNNSLKFSNTGYTTGGYPATAVGGETAFIVFNNTNNLGWCMLGGTRAARAYTCVGVGDTATTNSVGVLNNEVTWIGGTGTGTAPLNTTNIANFQTTRNLDATASVYKTATVFKYATGRDLAYSNAVPTSQNPTDPLTYIGVDASGTGGSSEYSYNGYLMEILVYNNRNISSQNIEIINSYLFDKWITNNGTPPAYRPCFLPSTRILTPLGYRRVETLKDYDQVETGDGRSVAVKVFKTYIAKTNQDTAPYCIPRGAIADGVPDEDLHVSGLHAIQDANGMWQFPMGLAMHKDNRVQQHLPGRPATYYHLECPNYFTDNLIANGCVAESFRNKQGREGITFEYCEEQRGFVRNREDQIKRPHEIPSDVLAVYS